MATAVYKLTYFPLCTSQALEWGRAVIAGKFLSQVGPMSPPASGYLKVGVVESVDFEDELKSLTSKTLMEFRVDKILR